MTEVKNYCEEIQQQLLKHDPITFIQTFEVSEKD
jgi:hypothetical protein